MQNRFTFKDNHPTGRYRSFDRMHSDIKLKRKTCGTIHELPEFDNWSIRFMVKSPDGFKWITLKYKPKSLKEAKEFLRNNTQAILDKFDLHFIEP